jgi:hypothetical protein
VTKVINSLNLTTDHFSNLYILANTLVSILANEIVTANSIAGGAMTIGNGFVSGIFGANTIVTTTIRGGNVGTTTAVAFGSNVTVTGFKATFGNLVANDTTLSVGANVIANTTTWWAGNTIANAFINSSAVSVANATGQTSITPTTFFSGNSTVNAFSNSTIDVIANSSSQAVFTPVSLLIGNTVSNSLVNSVAVVTPSLTAGGLSVANAGGFYYNGILITGGGGGGGVSGPNTSIQFANNALFGSSANLTYTWTTSTLQLGGATGNVVITPNSIVLGNAITVNSLALTFPQSALSSFNFTTVGTGAQVIDSFLMASYRSAEYLLSVTDNNANNHLLSKVLITHTGPGGDAFIIQFGDIITNSDMGSFSSSINATAAVLSYSPVSTSTTVKGNRIVVAL